MAGDILTAAAAAAAAAAVSDLMAALRLPSFLTATATGIVPSFVFNAGAAGKPGPAGNGFTPACTMC